MFPFFYLFVLQFQPSRSLDPHWDVNKGFFGLCTAVLSLLKEENNYLTESKEL